MQCKHEVVVSGMCADCGELQRKRGLQWSEDGQEKKTFRLGFCGNLVTSPYDVEGSSAYSHRLEREKVNRLVKESKKLILVLDLDHTLMQALPYHNERGADIRRRRDSIQVYRLDARFTTDRVQEMMKTAEMPPHFLSLDQTEGFRYIQNLPYLSEECIYEICVPQNQIASFFWVKLRPGLYDFLEKMCPLFEFYLFTLGTYGSFFFF